MDNITFWDVWCFVVGLWFILWLLKGFATPKLGDDDDEDDHVEVITQNRGKLK